jgi:hypothetical protein
LPEKVDVSSDDESENEESSTSESEEDEEIDGNPLIVEGKRSRRPAHYGPFISG